MAVETRPTSKFWYGRWQVNGERKCKQLDSTVAGTPGSKEFADSRLAAEEELQKLIEQDRIQRRPEDLVQRLHEVKFGRRIGSIPLARLAKEWEELPRKRRITATRLRYGRTVIKRFVDYLAKNHPKIREMAAVTPDVAEAFLRREEESRAPRPSTYNAELSLLRGAFERLRIKAGMLANPFEGNLVLKELDTQSRRPFTLNELEHLFETTCRTDPEIHDLIVVGAYTALRRGDACCLKWADVDTTANRIRVKTRKTGEPVSIPIFPRLREVLDRRPRTDRFVFPGLAASYETAPWIVNNRLRAAFIAAGLALPTKKDEIKPATPITLDAHIPEDDSLRKQVMARIDALPSDEVSPRVRGLMREVFDLYSSGSTLPDIAKQLDLSKGSVSNYLSRIEAAAGHPIVRKEVALIRKKQAIARLPTPEDPPSPMPTGNRRRVNTQGFHALRATFATQALAAGVPVAVVQLVTGHSLTQTVLKHYFNPDEKTVFNRMRSALPQLLGGGKPRDEQMMEILHASTPDTWRQDVKRLRALLTSETS